MKCTGFSILLSFEAFSGLVFASVWLAIIFILLARIQSFAHASFSERVVSQNCVGDECLNGCRSDAKTIFIGMLVNRLSGMVLA